VDLSLAASAWRKYQHSFDRITIKVLTLVQRTKENYRYSQAIAANPPQERFFPPAPSPAS
jgi:hypothetical protein